jgi:uncharacterized SAM-binding protein YcdF (DUF218 family)
LLFLPTSVLLFSLKSLILPLTEPLGAIWFLMVLITIYWAVRRKWKYALSLAVPVLLLFLVGATPLPAFLVSSEEQVYAKKYPETPADVVVVLGGGFYESQYDIHGIALTEAGSRAFTGMELARRGLTTNLVLGGSVPVENQVIPTSSKVQTWMKPWGLPGITLTNLGTCRDTHDEALAFRQLQAAHGWKSVILVTSALHMRRSAALFAKQGVQVTPVACDFRAYGTVPTPFSIIPGQHNFELLALYLHEKIGWFVYRCRGWI